MEQLPDRSKLINLLIQFEQKLEANIKEKKYKQFLKRTLKLQTLTESISKQLICFKLGLQSKIPKCIELTLVFLNRLFEGEFINIELPDYSQRYIIMKEGIKQKVVEPKKKIKQMLIRTLEQLVHFKNDNIDTLLIKSFEYLISEQIFTPILLLSERPQSSYFNLLHSYFSERFNLFQDIYIYSQQEAYFVNQCAPKLEQFQEQIINAQRKHNSLRNLTGMYLQQMICKVTKEGGKYGFCIVCHQQCNSFCKQTRASVCSLPCKQKHLIDSQKIDSAIVRSNILLQSIVSSLNQLFEFIKSQPKSLFIFIQLINQLLLKPYLFMVAKDQISEFFYNQLPLVIGSLFPMKQQKCQKLLYSIMGSVINIYKNLFLNDIEHLFLNKILCQLQSKNPKLESLYNIFNFLNNIFQNGQNFIQLYLNLDTAINRQNVIQRLMYELSRILQDRFDSNLFDYSKDDKNQLKKQCLDLHIKIAKQILQIPYLNEHNIEIDSIIAEKNRKTNIEKFLLKFNQNSILGIQSLYTVGLITAQNKQIEMLNIFKTVKNIKKKSIQQYLIDESNQDVLIKYIQSIAFQKKILLQALVEYYSILPLPENVTYQQNSSNLLNTFVRQYYKIIRKEQQWDKVVRWVKLFKDSENLIIDKFVEIFQYEQIVFDEYKTFQIYTKIKGFYKDYTQSFEMKTFYFDNSSKYLQIIQGQINLIQISVSHLLETEYDTARVLQLIRYLQQLCPNTPHLFNLIIKNTNFQSILTSTLNNQNMMCIGYLVHIPKQIPDCISEWINIIKFYNQVFYFTLSACLTPITIQNKQKILQCQIHHISQNIQKISNKISDFNFSKFVNAMFKLSISQIDYQRTFLLQKAFASINANVDKFVKQWDSIFPQMKIIPLKSKNQKIVLFCIHSIKQNLVISKKQQLLSNQQTSYFELFKQFYNNFISSPLKMGLLQVICYSIQNCQDLNNNSWTIIFELALQYVKQNEIYHQGVYRIIQNILQSNLLFFLNFYQSIFVLLRQMSNKSSKFLIKNFIDIQVLLEFLSKHTNKQSESTSDQSNTLKCNNLLNKLLPEALLWLIDKFNGQFFDNCVQVFFKLLRILILSEQKNSDKQNQDCTPHTYLNRAFETVIQITKTHSVSFTKAQNFIFKAANFGARIKFYYILQCLLKVVITNFNDISFIAVKGIKIFIQMLNPSQYNQWKQITFILMQIMDASRTKNIKQIQQIKNSVSNLQIIDIILAQKQLPEFTHISNVEIIMNKLIIQKHVFQMLPNDKQCLPLLKDVYKQIRVMNDNIYLRMCLWKTGFGQGSHDIPSLFLLEQIVVSRILSIYSFNQPSNQFYQFSSELFIRYSGVCHQLDSIQLMISNSNITSYQYELLVLVQNDLKKKKHLNNKFIKFLLPKLLQQNLNKQQKLIIGKSLVSLMGSFEDTQLLLKITRKLIC